MVTAFVYSFSKIIFHSIELDLLLYFTLIYIYLEDISLFFFLFTSISTISFDNLLKNMRQHTHIGLLYCSKAKNENIEKEKTSMYKCPSNSPERDYDTAICTYIYIFLRHTCTFQSSFSHLLLVTISVMLLFVVQEFLYVCFGSTIERLRK